MLHSRLRPLVALLVLLVWGVAVQAQVVFDTDFECGNGTDFTKVTESTYSFRIRPDTNSTDRQWFHFRVAGAAGQTLTFQLLGTNTHNVPGHWGTAWPVASQDGGKTWSHTTGARSHASPVFTFTHSFTADPEEVAFHFPYRWSDALERIAEWEQHPHVTRRTIGQSVQGRDIILLRVTDPAVAPEGGKKGFWLIARQHSAEVTGNFVLEGIMEVLLSDTPDGLALRQKADTWIVPMVNPDGVVAGNYRDNFAGVNLNRVWNNPSATTSPEVRAIVREVAAWHGGGNSFDFFNDLHSTSGANPHFAFHAASNIRPPLYPTPDTYHADTRRFLELVDQEDPNFDHIRGASTSSDTSLSRQYMTAEYGVLGFIYEGGYNRINDGPTPSAVMTPEVHRNVGRATARALVRYFELEPVATPDRWQVLGEH